MEEPPDSLNDLQPQDLSTSGPPAVMDLTKTGEERVFNPGPMEGLRVVRGPGWYSNISTGNHTVQFTGSSSSNMSHEVGEHIQPDNAFAHTTVTLSYVSRSHICSNQDSMSPSALYSAPPVSKMSLHPPCGTEESLGGTGYTGNQTELFLYQAKELHEFNGDIYSEQSLQGDEDRKQGLDHSHNGSLSCSEFCADSSVEVLSSVPEEEELGPVEPVVDGVGTGGEPCSGIREYMSPLEEPLSPSSTSADDVHAVFILPLASSSPSAHTSSVELMLCDGSSPEETNQSSSEVINKNSTPPNGREALLQPLNDLTDKVPENKRSTSVTHVNGNAQTLAATFSQRKLPPRLGRGTRLETIVMSINPGRYRRSESVHSSRKPKASQSSVGESSLVNTNIIGSRSVRKRRSNAKNSVKTKTRRKTASPAKSSKSVQSSTDGVRESTSDSERINHCDTLSHSTSPKSLKFTARQRSKRNEDSSPSAPSPLSTPRRSRRKALTPSSPSSTMCKISKKSEAKREPPVERVSPPTPLKKSPRKPKRKNPGIKTPPHAVKKSPARKPRKKKAPVSCFSSMFSPREPEIKLKYVNYKEVKRSRPDAFSPFIHTEPQQSSPSLYTIINYPEQVKTPFNKNHQQPHACSSVPVAVPSTSCLQLGRVSTHGQQQRTLVCCLCGQSANAMDLGDLHGPYYPEGFQPSSKDHCSSPGQKEEPRVHTDAHASVRSRRRRCSIPPTSLAVRQGAKLKKRRQCSGDGLSSPSAKKARCDGGGGDVDWYSPPVLPLEPCEYWLHEDCGVWSAGVFLVRGRVYGLEEAVRVAQETVCSACHCSGATLGCSSRGCVHKYHYRCALESDCVLIEENFAMKCKKHKNKTSKGMRWEYG